MKFLLQHKGILFFFFFTVCSLSFLIFQPGIWTYLDNAYQFHIFLNLQSFDIHQVLYWLSDITGGNYSGEYTQLTAGRYLNRSIELLLKIIGGAKWGAIAMYILFFSINYFVSKKVLSLTVGEKYAWLGALMYTFNPLSIYMLNMGAFIYAYSSVPLVILGFYYYFFGSKYYAGLLLFSVGSIFLTSYTRLTLIYPLFFILGIAIYYRELLTLIINQTKKCFILFAIVILTNLPFIMTIFYPIYSGEKEYFAGVANYASSFRGWGGAAYSAIKETSLLSLLAPLEPLPNFGYPLRDNQYFMLFSVTYFLVCILILLFRQHYLSSFNKNLFARATASVSLGVVSRLLPHYVPQDLFIYISYDLLPFLANDSSFAHWFVLAGMTVIVPLSINVAKGTGQKTVLVGTLIYCFWVVSVLMGFQSNYKLHTINTSSVPSLATTLNNIDQMVVGFSYPEMTFFDWSPYPVRPPFVSNIDNDIRTSPIKQANMSTYLSSITTLTERIYNLSILDISSFFVVQGIRNIPEGRHFDRYDSNTDYVTQAQIADNHLANNTGVVLVKKNELYKRYDIQDASSNSFSLYLPLSIIFLSGYENIFDTGLDLSMRPLLIDTVAYNKPLYIDGSYIVPNMQNQTLSIKMNKYQKWSYYLEVGGIASGQDVLLHFNRRFGVGWKVKHLDKKSYESIKCNKSSFYPTSANTECIIDSNFSFLQAMKYTLFSEKYTAIDHFEGNIVGNTWLLHNVTPDSQGNIYVLISHDKQYLFILTQIVALFTLFLLFIGIIYRSAQKHITPRNKIGVKHRKTIKRQKTKKL